MKDKKYKYVEDVIEEYLRLTDDQIEIPLQITKAKEKYDAFLKDHENEVLKADDTQHAFKIHSQLKKYDENKTEVEKELSEVSSILKDFLHSLNACKISYEKKDDSKSKITFLFWLEGEELKSNRV